MADDKFVPIELDAIPLDGEGKVAQNLYVHLPTANRFVCFVVKGDEIDARRLKALKSHAEPRLYVPTAVSDTAPPQEAEVKAGIRVDAVKIEDMKDEYLKVFAADGITPPADFRIDVISKQVETELRAIYKSILDPNAPDLPTIADKLLQMSDDIIKVIAPDVKDIKSHLIRNTKYLQIMNDASAISAIAVLFGLANGFDSQRSYRELAYATLVMDIALSEFDDAVVKAFYVNPDSLDAQTLQRLRAHPVKSHQLTTEKLKSITEVTKQLILTHHELHNGKGYPRGIRTDSIFPVARILAMAVDVFDEMKKDQLGPQLSPSLQSILRTFVDPAVQPHARRHNTKLVQTTLKFLGDDGSEATQAETPP